MKHDWIALLEQSSGLRNARELKCYREAFKHLKSNKTAAVLRAILLSIKNVDGGDYGEAQIEAMAACQRFPPAMFVHEFVDAVPAVWQQGNKWYKQMLGYVIDPEYEPRYFEHFLAELKGCDCERREFWKKRLSIEAKAVPLPEYKNALKKVSAICKEAES